MRKWFLSISFMIGLSSWAVCYFYLRYPAWFYLIGMGQRLKFPVGKFRAYDWTFPTELIQRNTRKTKKPNIILIIADDLGINDISGGNGISTPNIDTIYLNGWRLVNAYAGQATCAPSRASIFTGRYPTRYGFEFTPVPAPFSSAMSRAEGPNVVRKGVYHGHLAKTVPGMKDMILPASETHMSQHLKSQGYETAYVGKWHLGEAPGARPEDKGYDKFVGMLPGASLYLPIGSPQLVEAVVDGEPTDDFLRCNAVFGVVDREGTRFAPDEYLTDYFAHQAATAIQSQARSRIGPGGVASDPPPFFAVVSFNAPHNPYQALRTDYDDEEVARIATHKDRVYAAMIRALDRGVGIVLDAVRATPRSDNTLVIFTSDNGGVLYTGLRGVNAPYRGGKGTFFEGGLRVPLLLQWPARLTVGGGQFQGMTAHLDIFSTVIAAAGVDLSSFAKSTVVDGVDLVPFLKRAEERLLLDSECDASSSDQTCTVPIGDMSADVPHKSLYWRSGHYMAIIRDTWKLQVAERPSKLWLFDLARDPTELVNLAAQVRPETIELLTKSSAPGEYNQFLHYLNATRDGSASGLFDEASRQCLEVVLTAVHTPNTPSEITSPEAKYTNDEEAVSSALCSLLNELLTAYALDMVRPLWASLSETVVAVDGAAITSLDQEYVNWQN